MQVPLAWKPQFENQCFGVSPFPRLDIFRDSALCTLSVTQMFQLGLQNLTDWACPCCRSVAKLCPTLVTPGTAACQAALVLHCLPEFAQTHVHWIRDAIEPPNSLSFPSPLAVFPSSILSQPPLKCIACAPGLLLLCQGHTNPVLMCLTHIHFSLL